MEDRYTQTKERSAEVLRGALRLMGQHEARWTPLTFTVWYEHSAGINARLSAAIDECLRARPQLGDAEVLKLYHDHIAEVDHDSVQSISRELQRVMSGVVANASSTGASMDSFGDQMGQLAAAIKKADASALPQLLGDAADRASQLSTTTNSLAQQIADGQKEIERLRADLTRARDEALLDPMTRVLNRKGFDLQLQALMRQAGAAGPAHSLIMIDIDHFKKVNDTHGHVLGDRVIQGLAELLRRSVPEGESRVARYGGEEFAVLLPRTSVDQGVQVAEAVRQRAGAMKIRDLRTQKVVMSVTVSAGVAELQAGDDAPTWIARADAALYRSKETGRDRVTRA